MMLFLPSLNLFLVSTKTMRKRSAQKKKQKLNRRLRILKTYGCNCIYCNKTLTVDTMTIEHVTPKSKGGGNTLDNLRPACGFCNSVHRNPNDKDHKPRTVIDIGLLRVIMFNRQIYRTTKKLVKQTYAYLTATA